MTRHAERLDATDATDAPARPRARAARVTAAAANALLRSLTEAIDGGGLTLAWAVAHAADGGDPVAAAWVAADDDVEMFALLDAARLGPPVAPALWSLCPLHQVMPRRRGGRGCRRCVARIHARVPTLTLADILQAKRGEHNP